MGLPAHNVGLLFALVLQEAFGLDGCLGTTACCHNALTVGWVGNVACGINAFYACGSRRAFGNDEALWVEFQLTFEEVGVGEMTDSEEETVYLNVVFLFVFFALKAYKM